MSEILEMVEKGTVRLRVPELMQARGWNATELMKRSGLAYNTANALAKGYYDRIGMDTISALCKAFGCEPGDLFVYNKDTA